MLNYKQIWHGIKPIRWLNKFNLTDVFVALDVTFPSSRRFLAVEPCDRFAYGMRDISLSSDFCSCGKCLHYPIVACLDLSLVRGSKNCLAVGRLCVRFGADLILPFLTVSLVEAQFLPTNDVNCKVTLWGPGPTGR